MTAKVIAASNRITGSLLDAEAANQCGSDDNKETCGLDGEICKDGERCKKPFIAWKCVEDASCLASEATLGGMPEDAASICFGENRHVCVVCGPYDHSIAMNIEELHCPLTATAEERCAFDKENNAYSIYNCRFGNWEHQETCENMCKERPIDPVGHIADCVAEEIPYTCKVIGFELPQDVQIGDTLFSNAAEYAAAWIGFVGEPRYMVYYETFPAGIESQWTYDGMDVIVTAVAIGGIMNIGGGVFKAGWSGTKAGFAVVRRAGIKKGIGAAIKEGNSAAAERLAFEYGGKAALKGMVAERIVKRKIGGSVIGLDNVQVVVDDVMAERIIANAADTSALRSVFGSSFDDLSMNHYGALSDFSLMIRGGRNIGTDSVETIAKEWDLALTDTRILKMTEELNQLRGMHELTNFIDEPGQKAITLAIKKNIGSGVTEDKLKKSYLKVVSEEDGKIAKLKKLTKYNSIKEEQSVIYDKEIDEIAKDIYEDITRTAHQLPGDVADADAAQGMFMNQFKDAWSGVYNAESSTAATKELMDGLGKRGLALTEGVAFGGSGTLSVDLRKKLMVAALVGAYLAMPADANLEKYATCGSGKMCLHFPRFFGKDNNGDYDLGKSIMPDYDGLVMSTYPGAKTERFHIMSPCKTDLVIEAHDKDEEKINKRSCYADSNNNGKYDATTDHASVYTNKDGMCPPIVKVFVGTELESSHTIFTVIEDIAHVPTGSSDPIESYRGPFSCTQSTGETVSDALERCVKEIVYDDRM